jgi:hypothetical protein
LVDFHPQAGEGGGELGWPLGGIPRGGVEGLERRHNLAQATAEVGGESGDVLCHAVGVLMWW